MAIEIEIWIGGQIVHANVNTSNHYRGKREAIGEYAPIQIVPAPHN
jgi:hypothetical protein